MTKSYIKGYIEFFCKSKGMAWCNHISSLTNETTGRIEITPGEKRGTRQTYNVVTISYFGENMKTTTERKGVSLTNAVALFYDWDKN